MSPQEAQPSARPDAAAARRRVFIFFNIYAKAFATPPDEVLARFAGPGMEGERAKLVSGFEETFAKQRKNLTGDGLWADMEDAEQAFMNTGIFETTMRQRVDASWLAEPIMCLLWALVCRDQVLPYDQQSDPKSNNANQLREEIKKAVLRPQAEIDKQRDVAELWHWRCRTHMLLTTKKIPDALPNGTPMSEIIRMTTDKAVEEGLFPQSIGSDFPVFGKPFREISEEELGLLTSIAMERHKAFNWLCGYAPENRWSETPTDT